MDVTRLLLAPILRVVERNRRHLGKDRPAAVALDGYLPPRYRQIRPQERQAERMAERRTARDAGDSTDDFLALQDQVTFFRQWPGVALREDNADQSPRERLVLDDGEAALADVKRLVLA